MTRRVELRTTFDSAALAYHLARPDYPEQLYDALVELAEIDTGDRLLEVGCGTGRATLALARRGCQIVCIELGEALADAARQNVSPFSGVRVCEGDFETWQPETDEQFDVVFAATAWHWIDPAVGYRRAWELLRTGGYLAVWRAGHVFPDGGDTFFDEIQEVYDEIGEGLPDAAVRSRPGELRDDRNEIEQSGFFEEVRIRQFDWEMTYAAEEYIRLLNTFSNHIGMARSSRDRLYAQIRQRLGERSDGCVRRHWGAVLHVARRVDVPGSVPEGGR